MSSKLYDEALVAKLKAWTDKTNVQVYSPDDTRKLFEVIADTTKDAPIKLPIICLRRRGGFTIENPNKKPLTYDGMMIESDESTDTSVQVNAVPISIPYQLDVYTRYYSEADAYIRNLIFNIINYPTLQVTVPYNDTNIEHYANIRLSGVVDDLSDIPERLQVGQFTRLTLTIDLDDAYLWDVRARGNVSIDVDGIVVQIKDNISDIIEQVTS